MSCEEVAFRGLLKLKTLKNICVLAGGKHKKAWIYVSELCELSEINKKQEKR